MNDLLPILLAALLLIAGAWPSRVEPPVPEPKPPTPVVVDAVKDAWVIVVRESESQTPAQGQMLDTVRKAVLAMGQQFRIYDPDAEVVAQNGYVAKATAGLPALFVQSSEGKTLLNQRLPGTAEDVLAAVRKATGAK